MKSPKLFVTLQMIYKNYNGYEKIVILPHGNDGRADPFGTAKYL